MGWSAGDFGIVGDDPWDITGSWIDGVRATPGELASALQQVIDSTPTLVADPEDAALWQVGGVEMAPTSAKLIDDLRVCARRVSASFEDGIGRKPTVPELVCAFSCKYLDARPELRSAAIHDPRLEVRKALARHPLAPETVLAVLARDSHAAVSELAGARLQRIERLREAKDPTTTAGRLLEIARSANHEIAVALLENPALPADVLGHLLDHAAPEVRVSIASHPRTPAPVIERIARDIKWMVRNPGVNLRDALAENPRTPPDILAKMAEHFGRGALGNPSTPADALERAAAGSLTRHDRVRLARNPATPSNVLQQLARDDDWYVRVGVAANPSTPPATLEELTRDREAQIRASVARRLASVAFLEQLADDRDPDVVRAVIGNSNTPSFVLEVLALHADPAIRETAESMLARQTR